jgi:hypothetical protein
MGITDHGRAHCLRRLSAATSVDDLRTVWERLSIPVQSDEAVAAHKDKMKARFKE